MAEDELRQVEAILLAYSARKRMVVDRLNLIVENEDRVLGMLEGLDKRIREIGNHTVNVEKKIRILKGDSVFIDHDSDLSTDCVKVATWVNSRFTMATKIPSKV